MLDVGPDAIREELNKILASQAFRSAQGQKAFIRYVVEEAIAGRGHQLKESNIGIEALNRGESFDPRLDPIVRTQATKLRARLAKYYETEGQHDRLRIELQKGSYTPVFRRPKQSEEAELTVAESNLAPGDPKRWTRLPWSTGAVVLVVLFLLASGSAAFWALRSGYWDHVRSRDTQSIAVLPFVSVGDRNDREFLTDGLAEELIDSLQQFPELQVVARTSAFRFKGKPVDIREIARQLHVQSVVVGSIHETGRRVRVAVQLNSASDNYHLWSGSYERELGDLRSVPSEIAMAVANVLGLGRASRSTQDFIRRQFSPNPAAYQGYLKGLYFWNKLTDASLKVAIRYFEEAIAEDPSFARAHAALADCYVMEPQVATAAPAEVLSKIRAAASRATELDSTLGEPHFDLAIAAEYEFDWATAEKEFQVGLKLSPGNAVGHLWYAKYLALVGRKDEVLIHRRIAAELDPVSPYAVQALAGYLSVVGHYDEAIRQFCSALALDPNFGLAHQGLGMAYVLKGMRAEGIAEFQKANQFMNGPKRMGLLGWAYAVSGKTAEARAILKDFLRRARNEPFPALAIAQVYIGLGENDSAFEWLEKAIDQKDLDLTLKWDSPYEPLRSDVRYTALLRRMKLA